MQLGLVGLGKMGANMRKRLVNAGIEVVGYDPKSTTSDVSSLAELVDELPTPRNIWVMVPADDPTNNTTHTSDTIKQLAGLLSEDDLVINGGNSRYTDDQQYAKILAEQGIGFLDCGVSGGIWGLTEGYGLMVGGDKEHVSYLMPVFDALRPAGPREEGFVHAGKIGAGHFAKMVHNGVEYGVMQAYAEGFELLEGASDDDLITDTGAVLKAWKRGTVVRSWLLDLLVAALDEDPKLAKIKGWVSDTGEGRWTLEAALKYAVAIPAISAAVFARFVSRQEDSPAMKAVAALRQQFGGHAVKSGK